MDIPFIKSPNFTKGRGGKKIKYIIIHSMAGFYEGSQAWFKNPKSQVSAHYLISQKGEVVQMVRDTETAWQCHNLNSQSIGIELEDKRNTSSPDWITKELYEKAVELTADLCKKHSIPIENIYTHCDPFIQKINGKGWAHSDPGPHWDNSKFREDVAHRLQ